MSSSASTSVLSPGRSLLHVVAAADQYPYPHQVPDPVPSESPERQALVKRTTSERHVPFHLSFSDHQRNLAPIGLLRPQVLEVIQAEAQADENEEQGSPWQFYHTTRAVPSSADRVKDDGPSASKQRKVESSATGVDSDDAGGEDLELVVECVFFSEWVQKGGRETMEKVMNDTVKRWRDQGIFNDELKGWRNEQYDIYASPLSTFFQDRSPPLDRSKPFSNVAFPLERSSCALFGLGTFGVHMTAYEGQGEDLRIWVPRRAKTKQTYPGMLDSTVGGGIPTGMSPLESMLKECAEEASLPLSFVQRRIKNVGITSGFLINENGWMEPEVEYVYEMQVPPVGVDGFEGMKPGDEEVETFKLMTIPEVIEALHAREFKPNCGTILVDFLMRHGYLTPENEPNFFEIGWRMRRRLEVAVPM